MITKKSFKHLLTTLGFTENKQVYTKNFDGFELKADFKKEELFYPENKGLKINERQTCNFSSNENFVVFECVYRLFEKGYKPKHIELEPKWKLGHGASGGRADIWVKDNNNNSLLIIECKTAGKEFENAWKDTLEDGGQLFSYFQQEKSTQFLALYASDFSDNKTKFDYKLITVRDDMMKLAENKTTLSYEKAKSVKDLFKVWKETYAFISFTNGLFDDNISAYINKKITVADLKEVDNESIIRNTANGANINNLSSTVSEIKIPLPPLDIQKQIVIECKKIDKASNEAQTKIEQLKNSIAQTMQNVKGDKKKIGDIGKIKMCKRIFKDQTTFSGEIPFYKIGTFGKEPDAFISEKLYNEFRSKYPFPKQGDILISAAGTIGKTVVYDGKPAYFQDSNIVWIDNNEKVITNSYLNYVLQNVNWKSQQTDGGIISRLYNDNLRKLEIFVPSFTVQQEIVKEIEIYESKISEAQKIIDGSAEEKQKILEKYLN